MFGPPKRRKLLKIEHSTCTPLNARNNYTERPDLCSFESGGTPVRNAGLMPLLTPPIYDSKRNKTGRLPRPLLCGQYGELSKRFPVKIEICCQWKKGSRRHVFTSNRGTLVLPKISLLISTFIACCCCINLYWIPWRGIRMWESILRKVFL